MTSSRGRGVVSRPRLGVTVSRRIGGAVARNYVKRRVRECFRLALRRLMPPCADLVVIARAGAADLAAQTLSLELISTVHQLAEHRR